MISVCGVARDNEAAQDHGGTSPGKKYLMPVFGVPFSFYDNVGMAFKERDYLFRCRDLFILEDPAVGLVDYLTENTECPFEPPGKLMGGKGAHEVMAFIVYEFISGGFGISFHQPCVVEEILVRILPYCILFCIEYRHDPLFHHPPVVTELIPRWGCKFLSLGEPPGDNPDAVGKKGRVRGVVNIGLHRG